MAILFVLQYVCTHDIAKAKRTGFRITSLIKWKWIEKKRGKFLCLFPSFFSFHRARDAGSWKSIKKGRKGSFNERGVGVPLRTPKRGMLRASNFIQRWCPAFQKPERNAIISTRLSSRALSLIDDVGSRGFLFLSVAHERGEIQTRRTVRDTRKPGNPKFRRRHFIDPINAPRGQCLLTSDSLDVRRK